MRTNMTVTRKWMHPDVILGKCIEEIGHKMFQLTVTQRQRAYAWRKDAYSAKLNYSAWPKKLLQYPLWNAADFRRDTGGFEKEAFLDWDAKEKRYHRLGIQENS